jgi:hypothetical protein
MIQQGEHTSEHVAEPLGNRTGLGAEQGLNLGEAIVAICDRACEFVKGTVDCLTSIHLHGRWKFLRYELKFTANV